MKYASPKLEKQFNNNAWLKVCLIATLADAYSQARFGVEFTVTSIIRIGSAELIHHTGRAIDLDDDTILTSRNKKEIENFINGLFVYDPQRPQYNVAIYHTVQGHGGDHLHLQVHPRTTNKVIGGE